MNTQSRAINSRRGITRVEVLAIIAILSWLAMVQIPAMAGAKGRTSVIVCSENVQLLTMALRMYGDDNNSKLPALTGTASWAWDVPGNVTAPLLSYGLRKKNFYCPTTAPQFTDKENFLDTNSYALWSFGVPPGVSDGSPNAFHIIGYTLALSGQASMLNARYQNTKITSESHSTGGTTFYDSPASRVLVADEIISGASSYPASANEPFRGIAGGFYKAHLSAHLGNGGIPNGGNLGYKDGHVGWKKFNSPPAGFSVPAASPWLSTEDTYTMVRTVTSPYFWW